MIPYVMGLQLAQMLDSRVPTTREYWRKRFFAASDAEATDPRPFLDVLRERTPVPELDILLLEVLQRMLR